MAYDPATKQLVLFGGRVVNIVNQTWTWDGRTWTQASPATSPPAREGATMAYDPAIGRLVLFGGVGASSELNDTWTWDGRTWTQASPATSPPARWGASMAYDPASGNIVLFGGRSPSRALLGDTWTWDGRTWTQASPATSPPARENAPMAYDPAAGRLVLFGGVAKDVGQVNDTWTWNSTTWTKASPSTSPPATRTGASMAYDPATGHVVLFGGYGSTGVLNDTWTWNGTTWTKASPATSPPARFLASMAYDPATGNVVLFGGYNGADLNDTWTYGLPPTVTSLSPSVGPSSGGTTVTITGTGLFGASVVTFGSTPATSFTVNTPTSITATSPAVAPGTVDVRVTTSGGTSATSLADQFTFHDNPTVTSVNPNRGPTSSMSGRHRVTITGENFFDVSEVTFGSTPANFTVDSPTSVTAYLPPHPAGTVNVRVTATGGTSPASFDNRFLYQAAPTVTGVSPNAGPTAGGTPVFITGTDFTAAESVYFGTRGPMQFFVLSDNVIVCISPSYTAGAKDVYVITPGGLSAASPADVFTYQNAPVVTAVKPDAGPTAGGTSVTITGNDFKSVSAVKFGTTPATSYTVNSDTSITATAPAASAGAVDVTVTTPGGTSATSSADNFTYQNAPTVTSVSPNSGSTAGGTSVVITGTDFIGTSEVKFGSAKALYTVTSPTSITATSPAHAAGTVNVQITTPEGFSPAVPEDLFTFT